MDVGGSLDRFFHMTERGTNVRIEFKGALLTFLAMSYIMVVNPTMMVDAGIDYSVAYTSTILISAFGCIMMGLYANYPVALAPAMGVNAFFVYTVVLGMGYSWIDALMAMFLAGIIFLVTSISGLREKMLHSIPMSIKRAITVGIGCFITFIGLSNAGLIVSSPSTLITLGDVSNIGVALSLFSVLVTLLFRSRGISVAALIGMVLTAILGLAVGVISPPDAVFSIPALPELGAMFTSLDSISFDGGFLMVTVSAFMVLFFDGSGTLIATAGRADLPNEGDDFARAMVADAATVSASAVIGTTPASAFAESTVGIEAGSRTGLTPIIIALFFIAALFIGPLFQIFDYHCTVGAMTLVAIAMMSEVKGIDWGDWPVSAAAVITILMMLLTYSITNGIIFGIIVYTICMLGAGRVRELNVGVVGLTLIFVVYLFSIALFL